MMVPAGTFRHRKFASGDSGVSKQLLRDTVHGWISGQPSTETATDGLIVSEVGPTSSAGLGPPQSVDVRHAEEVLSQQLAEAQALLSVEGGCSNHSAAAGAGHDRSSRNPALTQQNITAEDADCESCTARWFLMPHEGELVCSLGSTELSDYARRPPTAASRPGMLQRGPPSGSTPSRGHSTGSFKDRQRQQPPRGSDIATCNGASCRHPSRSAQSFTPSERFAPSDNPPEQAEDDWDAGKRQEWACSWKERSRRDCFCPRCCAERVCGGLGATSVRKEDYRREQRANSRVKYTHGHTSSSGSPPAPCSRSHLRAESVPSRCRRPGVSSAVLRSKIAATDRASAALAAGRAALAQSIRRRKQREAVGVDNNKCRHMR